MKPLDPRLLRHAKATRRHLVVLAVLGAAMALAVVAQATLLARVITAVFLDGAGLADVEGELVALAGVAVLRAILVGLRELTGRLTAGRVTADLRRRLLGRTLELGPVGLGRERRGELAATATTGLDALDTYFAGYLPQLVLAVVVPAVVLLRLLPVDPTAVAIMVATIPLIPIFMTLVGWAAQSHTQRQWRVLSRLSAHYLDVIEGLPTLRAFGRAEAQVETVGRVAEDYRRATMRTLRISFLSALVLELIATLSVALVAVAVGLRVVHGDLALEPALTVLILAPEVYLPLRQVGARFHDAMAGVEACERTFAVLEAEGPATGPGAADGAASPTPALDLRRQAVVLDGVGFTYPGRANPVLTAVDLRVEPGTTVAVVGPSGAGKSTLASLLLRFAEPDAGALLLDGPVPLDVRAVPVDRWRRQLAWLPQRPRLLTATVAENVRLARPEATDDEVRAALAAAHVLDVVDALPGGLAAPVAEDGSSLSAGERRRLALARVFLRGAPLVVVDEPTASLDAESEAAVLAGLDDLRSRCTLVVVAHRPLLPSDLVVEVADGLVTVAGPTVVAR